MTRAVAASAALGGLANEWLRSIDLAALTGACYSQGFPIEPPAVTNALGRRYEGNVVLITDARCYSTRDIFAGGFQDNQSVDGAARADRYQHCARGRRRSVR